METYPRSSFSSLFAGDGFSLVLGQRIVKCTGSLQFLGGGLLVSFHDVIFSLPSSHYNTRDLLVEEPSHVRLVAYMRRLFRGLYALIFKPVYVIR
jgi:hypothetical protein